MVVEELPRPDEDYRRLEEKFTFDDYFLLYYPMKEKLCINSLLAGLADGSVYVNRGVLDFLISHIPFTGRVNSDLENVKLVEGALQTLNRRDFAFIKKFFIWVLGHIDDDVEQANLDESDPVIRILVPALKCVFKKYLDKNEISKMMPKDQNKPGGAGAAQQQSQFPYHIPVLLTQQVLGDNAATVEPILFNISVDLISYIRVYYDTDLKDPKRRLQ